MKKYNPLISIIIPVYNGSNYLKEAIDSALAQTYQHIEILVINDGSTDGGKTEAIAKSYGNKIRYFNKKNGYVSSALNYGIKRMKGEWFAWLSHDDYYLREKSATEIKYLKSHPDSMVLFCDTGVMNAKGEKVFEESHSYPGKIRGGIWAWKAWIYGCSMLIRKDCFKKTGLFNVDNRTTQDVEMTLALLANYNFHHIPKVLVRRRDHIESDFHTLKVQNSQDRDHLFLKLLDRYGIGYFLPGVAEDKAYLEFGRWLYVSNPEISNLCFKKSYLLNKSLLNPAAYLSRVDMRLPRAIKLTSDFVAGSFRGLYRRLV